MLDALSSEGLNGQHRIERIFDDKLPPLMLDVFKMEQAFNNVLKNALQAMPEGGTLRIETHHDPERRQVLVSFRDTGTGIQPDDLPNVFRPFFTTKPGGTGLGLAISSRIVDAHGGRLSVMSTQGQGTEFTFMLPESSAR
jgi:signal transduction histidine kinase